MGFFARPDLSDIQFKQLNNSVLTLSGQTRIHNITGLTLYDGIKNIPVVVTGATSGDVLTYLNGKIVLAPTSGGVSGGTNFNTHRVTTRATIPAVCVGGACTLNNFLEGYFFPAVPLSTTLSVATGGALRQFGDCSIGNLCWNVTKNTYPITNIGAATNGSAPYNCTILSSGSIGTTGGTVSYTYPFVCATPSSAITSTNVAFGLCAKTCCNEISISSTSITWENKKFYFGNSTLYGSSAISTAMCVSPSQPLTTDKTLNISQILNNQFFYYAYPKVMGVPTFSVNGLPNNAWGNPATGTLFSITFVNSNGYSNQYYVARSDSKITGIFCITAL